MPKSHIEETKSGEASCARCVSIYWSVQKLLSAPHPPPVHHIYSEITETERCDDFMREFPQIRKDLFNRLGKYDLEPGILERIKSLRVNDYDKEVLEQNYHHYRWWLIRYAHPPQNLGKLAYHWKISGKMKCKRCSTTCFQRVNITRIAVAIFVDSKARSPNHLFLHLHLDHLSMTYALAPILPMQCLNQPRIQSLRNQPCAVE